MHTLQTKRKGGREGGREVGGIEIALSSCISDTLVKQDVCCRHVLYTWWYTTAIQKHNYTDISGLPFQVAKFSMTRLYKPIVLHMHTSSLLCTQSHCRYKHTVVSHTKHDITRKAGTGSSLGNSIQTPWPTQGLKEEHCQHPGNTTLSYKTHKAQKDFATGYCLWYTLWRKICLWLGFVWPVDSQGSKSNKMLLDFICMEKKHVWSQWMKHYLVFHASYL